MGDVVHVGQGAGDEDVALPLDGEDWRLFGLGRGHGWYVRQSMGLEVSE